MTKDEVTSLAKASGKYDIFGDWIYEELSFTAQYSDEQGLFADINFKILVLRALMLQKSEDYAPAWLTEFDKLVNHCYDEYFTYDAKNCPAPELCSYAAGLHFSEAELAMVTELEAAADIYHYMMPAWKLDDVFFDIRSIAGFEHLKNLKSVAISDKMIDESLLKAMADKGIEIK